MKGKCLSFYYYKKVLIYLNKKQEKWLKLKSLNLIIFLRYKIIFINNYKTINIFFYIISYYLLWAGCMKVGHQAARLRTDYDGNLDSCSHEIYIRFVYLNHYYYYCTIQWPLTIKVSLIGLQNSYITSKIGKIVLS